MFILFGERLQTRRGQVGMRRCDVCDREEEFFQITEVNYFSLFAIPVSVSYTHLTLPTIYSV